MLPTYGSFPDQESTFILVPAIGKKCPLEIAGLPRSSSSDSSCTPLVGVIGERRWGGTAEVFAVEGLGVEEVGLRVPLESGPKEEDTPRKARTFFPNETNIPDDVGSRSTCSLPSGCCPSLGPGRSSVWLRKAVWIDDSESPRALNPRCVKVAW